MTEPTMEFQKECSKSLREGRSVLVVAPTGLGKTRAALTEAAATDDGLLGTRTIYALPMRALAGGIKEQFDQLLASRQCTAVIHHGQKPDSKTFCEPAIVTTVDQYFTAFAGVPLSFTAKEGHAAAGALLTSYSVFDEAHLLDARAGLPLLFAVLQQRQRWGLQSCVMTATLPKSVVEHFETKLNLTVIQVLPGSEDATYRDSRRHVTIEYVASAAPEAGVRSEAVWEKRAEIVLNEWQAQGAKGRVLVFCNTVPAARQLYDLLSEKVGAKNVVLAHSRFTPCDRDKLDRKVSQRFGKGGDGGILVTTQVSEAGLNISAPVVFSELAPADSLIQRAGRCARFYHDVTPDTPLRGRFIVWPLWSSEKPPAEKDRAKACLPYNPGVVEATLNALTESIEGAPVLSGSILDWGREQEFVNESLSDFYSAFSGDQDFTKEEQERRSKEKRPLADKRIVPLSPISVLGAFERAYHARSADVVERLLRDSITVRVGVVTSFKEALAAYNVPEPEPRRYPETISIRLSTFAGLLKDRQAREVIVRHTMRKANKKEADEAEEQPMRLGYVESNRLRPNATYLMLASEAGYSPETGLGIAKQAGTSTRMLTLSKWERGQKQRDGNRQTWREHALGAHEEACRILPFYRPFIAAWAASVYGRQEQTPEEVAAAIQDVMELAVVLHDIGKLNHHWQDAVGRFLLCDEPIARTSDDDKKRLREARKPRAPFHAQYVFPLLKAIIRSEMPSQQGRSEAYVYRLYEHIALAAARHHALTLDGSINQDEDSEMHFRWTPGGERLAAEVIQAALKANAPVRLEDRVWDCLTLPQTGGEAPAPTDDDYFLYCLTNRLTIFSDICHAGAGPLELCTVQHQGDDSGECEDASA